jgi:hypothetical protein
MLISMSELILVFPEGAWLRQTVTIETDGTSKLGRCPRLPLDRSHNDGGDHLGNCRFQWEPAHRRLPTLQIPGPVGLWLFGILARCVEPTSR